MSQKRLKRHIETIQSGYLPVVFCVKCGSTKLDQNFLTELRCYDCGNTLAWDGRSFSINRDVAMAKGLSKASLHDSYEAFCLSEVAS